MRLKIIFKYFTRCVDSFFMGILFYGLIRVYAALSLKLNGMPCRLLQIFVSTVSYGFLCWTVTVKPGCSIVFPCFAVLEKVVLYKIMWFR